MIEEFTARGYQGLYEKAMLLEQSTVNEILEPIIEKILPLYRNGELLKSQESFWAARAAENFCTGGNYDRGIFSIYIFNLVHLKKGEGIYQGAQLPHAYLEGQNIELMANSDNVLRAGLTEKHIDVDELLKHVAFRETIPNVLGSAADVQEELFFETPAEEFELYQYHLQDANVGVHANDAEIILVLEGSAAINSGSKSFSIKKGEAVFVIADTDYTITSSSSELFRATTPSRTFAK